MDKSDWKALSADAEGLPKLRALPFAMKLFEGYREVQTIPCHAR